MNIEDKIKELEAQLALKQAYLSVGFTFSKNNKLPKEVKEQVTAELKKACTQLADGQDGVSETTSSRLSSEEVTILKKLAETVLKKSSEKPSNSPVVPLEGVKRARLMLLDNIDSTLRSKIQPESIVNIVKNDGKRALVQCNNMRFSIPIEDLEFNI